MFITRLGIGPVNQSDAAEIKKYDQLSMNVQVLIDEVCEDDISGTRKPTSSKLRRFGTIISANLPFVSKTPKKNRNQVSNDLLQNDITRDVQARA
eukprot:757123-Hanusia_phi.AAC.3